MSDISPLPPPEPTYQAIEATLAGHERGRRFLAEHARRSRHEEAVALLDAVARLHEQSTAAFARGLETDLPALRDLTASAEESLADATTSHRSADDDVFDMVEGIQETAWSMREAGTDASLCDLLDHLAIRLGRACRGREQRDLALERAKAAVSRLGQHLADLGAHPAGRSGELDVPGSDRAGIAGPDQPAEPDGIHPAAASDLPPPAPARPKRKSRPRGAAPARD